MRHRVRRVRKDKVPRRSLLYSLLKISLSDRSMTKVLGHSLQIAVGVRDEVFSANWDIKVAVQVNPVNPIEAGSVQVEETYRLLNRIRRVRRTDVLTEPLDMLPID